MARKAKQQKEPQKMARKIEKTIDTENGTLTVGFTSGESAVINMSDFSDEIVFQLAMHGLSQKVTDAGAGKDAAETEAHVGKLIEALKSGQWTVRGEGGGGAGRVTQVVQAVARVKNISVEEAKEKLAALSEADRKAVAASGPVQQAILEIKAENLAARQEKEADKASEGDAVLDSL